MKPVASTMPISDSIVTGFFLIKLLVPLMQSTVDLVRAKEILVRTQLMTLLSDSSLFSASIVERACMKLSHYLPIPPFIVKTRGGKGASLISSSFRFRLM